MTKVVVNQANDGQWYFVVVRRNGRVFGASETYTRRGDALRAAHAFVKAMQGSVRVVEPKR